LQFSDDKYVNENPKCLSCGAEYRPTWGKYNLRFSTKNLQRVKDEDIFTEGE